MANYVPYNLMFALDIISYMQNKDSRAYNQLTCKLETE